MQWSLVSRPHARCEPAAFAQIATLQRTYDLLATFLEIHAPARASYFREAFSIRFIQETSMGLFDRKDSGNTAVAHNDQRLNELKQKYGAVLRMVEQQGIRLQNVHIENDKLLIRGEAPTHDAKNRVWDQIKLVDPSWSNDLVADISVNPNAVPQATASTAAGAGQKTYTVKSGDTLSKIARDMYGDAGQYMKIFDANRDKLNDPDKIHPGQNLVIPA
jgi:LysM repeat protein